MSFGEKSESQDQNSFWVAISSGHKCGSQLLKVWEPLMYSIGGAVRIREYVLN